MNKPIPDSLTDFDHIPQIDLAGMHGDDPAAKARVASALRKACTEVGFFYIVNHGVPEDLIANVFSRGRELFDWPLDRKMGRHSREEIRRTSSATSPTAMRTPIRWWGKPICTRHSISRLATSAAWAISGRKVGARFRGHALPTTREPR